VRGGESTRFFAEFYLARIYSNAHADHAKAYLLFQKLADENADADPDDGRRAPFVAKALTELATYLRRGVREIGVRPDLPRAVEYLNHAATFFGDKDAQFELAKFYLSGTGSEEEIKRGKHWLSVLTEEGYPAAQALLAELLWRGRYVKKDERRALALITMAVENAPAHERMWIEELYQHMFCATSQGTRKQADGLVAVWRKMFSRPAEPTDRMALGVRELPPRWSCGNGEQIVIQRADPAKPELGAPAGAPPAAAAAPPGRADALQGSTLSIGVKK
jgi:TPR repeat protein